MPPGLVVDPFLEECPLVAKSAVVDGAGYRILEPRKHVVGQQGCLAVPSVMTGKRAFGVSGIALLPLPPTP